MEFDIVQEPQVNFEDTIESIPDTTSCNTLQDLEKLVNQILGSLPKLNRMKLRKEMEGMNVQMYEAPTTFDINKGLAIAQAYKDRLSEIYNLAYEEYRVRKRCCEMLLDTVQVLSKQSSADKRKGEATMKYPMLLIQLDAAETFLKEVEQINNNIKSCADSISRQGSIISAQISLGEYTKRAGKINENDAEEKLDYHSNVPKVNMEWDDIR